MNIREIEKKIHLHIISLFQRRKISRYGKKWPTIFIATFIAFVLLLSCLVVYSDPADRADTYFQIQNERYIDPYSLIQAIKRADQIVIIDVRAPELFLAGHIINAINVPVSQDGDFDTRRIKELANEGLIILYGENQYSRETMHIAEHLSAERKEFKLLTIGWNEFRNFTTFWLPEKEWNIFDILEYIESAK